MHIHNAYFWLKAGSTAEDLAAFEDGLRSLIASPEVSDGYFGRPADSEARDVVDNTYTYGLILTFPDTEAHDRYQEGANHAAFVADHLKRWERVQVYDVQT